MKKSVFFLAAAAMAFAACNIEIVPENKVTFSAQCETSPSSKAVLGINGESKPQTFWEFGDAINIFSSGNGDTQSGVAGYQFVTSLGNKAVSADFTCVDDGFVEGNLYYATYPYRNNKRGVNFTGADGTYRLAGLQIPASQTLAVGTFDKSAALSVAFAEGGSKSLQFKNATALIKFRVSDSDIVNGRIKVDDADAIAGTFRADVATDTKALSLETYGQPVYSAVEFSIDGSTPLATGTDYYVAVRPTSLTSSLKIYLNETLVKTIDNSSLPALERNKIYNLGALALPAAPPKDKKTLVFDFSGDPLDGWPTADKWKNAPGELTCKYALDGTEYSFFLTDVGNASSARMCWDKAKGGLIWYAGWRYLGLPAISGYKLIKVSGEMCLSTNSKRKAGIVTAVASTNDGETVDSAHTFVSGGASTGWTTQGTTYTFNLEGTEANTVYYLLCTATSIGVSSLELVYEEI